MSMDHILSAAAQSPDSPFLPNTNIQYAWDSVSLTSILSCPRQYKYRIIDGLVPKGPGYAIALVFGILFHKGLEIYHRQRANGFTHDESVFGTVRDVLLLPETATLPVDDNIDAMAESHDPDEDDGIALRNSKIRTRYYLIRSIVWYLENYADDPFTTITGPTGAPAVELSFRVPLDIFVAGTPMLLCGHIDRAVEFNDRLYVTDYKTTKSLTRQYFDMFKLSHQMTGYIAAGEVIFDQPVKGCWVDGVALQVGQVKFGRAPITKTPGEKAEYFDLLGYVAEKAQLHHDAQSYPMNTASCYFCDFKAICQQPPEYREQFIKTYFHSKRGWNPLENR